MSVYERVRRYHLDRLGDPYAADVMAQQVDRWLARDPDGRIEDAFARIDKLAAEKADEDEQLASQKKAEADRLAREKAEADAEAAELAASDLRYEYDCEACGPRGPKYDDSVVMAPDDTPLVLVFPAGRIPESDDRLKCYRMRLANRHTWEYAELLCDHRPDDLADMLKSYTSQYGAQVTSLAVANLGGYDQASALPEYLPEPGQRAIAGFATPLAIEEPAGLAGSAEDVEPVDAEIVPIVEMGPDTDFRSGDHGTG